MKDDVKIVDEPGIGRPDGLKGIFGALEHHFVYKLKSGEFRRIIHLEPNVSTVEMQKSSTERDYAKNDPVVIHAACDSKGGMELVKWLTDEWRRANAQEKEAGAGSVVEITKTTLPKFRFWNLSVTPEQRQNGYPGCVATMVGSFKKMLAPVSQFKPFFTPTHLSESGIGFEDEADESQIKAIKAIVDQIPVDNEDLLKLVRELREHEKASTLTRDCAGEFIEKLRRLQQNLGEQGK